MLDVVKETLDVRLHHEFKPSMMQRVNQPAHRIFLRDWFPLAGSVFVSAPSPESGPVARACLQLLWADLNPSALLAPSSCR
jgi:hypothetical protein